MTVEIGLLLLGACGLVVISTHVRPRDTLVYLVIICICQPLLAISLPVDLRVLALFVAFAASYHRIGRMQRGAAVRYLAVLTFVTILSSIFAPNLSIAVTSSIGGLVAVGIVATLESAELIDRSVVAISNLTAVLSIVAVAGHIASVSPSFNGRIAWPAANPNGLAMLLVIGAAATVLSRGAAWKYFPIVVAVILTASRNGSLSLAVGLTAALVARPLARHRTVAGTAWVLLLLAVPFTFSRTVPASTVTPDGSSLVRATDTRTDLWLDGFDQVLANGSWRGLGAGSYPRLLPSSWLLALVEFGLPLFAVLVWLLGRAIRSLGPMDSRLSFILAAFAVNGSFESWWFVASSPFLILASIVLVSREHETRLLFAVDHQIEPNLRSSPTGQAASPQSRFDDRHEQFEGSAELAQLRENSG